MALAVGAVVLVAGGGAIGAAGQSAAQAAGVAAAATSSGTVSTLTEARAGSALAVLDGLPVKGRAPKTGYVRTVKFGAAWLDVDRNGCDTRDDILRRDLTKVVRSRCTVRSGVLADPYTKKRIVFARGEGTSTAVQIDHVVALSDAWQTGAQRLSQAKRVALANDPINLFAVDGPTNNQKSDSDAASWLPPNKAFRCTYVAHQVGVKKAYGLWVTKAEKAAMQRVLRACPTMRAPASTTSKLVFTGAGATGTSTTTRTATPTPSTSTSTSQPTTSTSQSADAGVVHPGSYCSPEGATGRTSAGTAMACTSKSAERPRWRSA